MEEDDLLPDCMAERIEAMEDGSRALVGRKHGNRSSSIDQNRRERWSGAI